MWIDAHCHLADPRWENSLEDYLEDARALGISAWIQGGVGPDDWSQQKMLEARFPGQVYSCYGLHPWWVAQHTEAENDEALKILKTILSQARGFGELGLDFGKRFEDSEIQSKQIHYFEKQLEWAEDFRLPLVLHIVQAHEKAIGILKTYPISQGGIIHSFSASINEAKRYLDLGFSLSISGVVARKGYEKLKDALKALPGDKIVLETDAPDQRPDGVDETLNLPKNLLRVAKAVAMIRGESEESVLKTSTDNIKRIFHL